MGQDLIERREQAMDNADRALDAAWPRRVGDEYVCAMRAAAGELEEIASKMKAARMEGLEQSRLYRYLGSVFSDLAPALGKEMLSKAKAAYQEAEELLRGEKDEFKRAKHNFNYGNTLRQLDPNDMRQLEEAKERFLVARSCFTVKAPQFLDPVDTALQSVDALLRVAPLLAAVEKNLREMAVLEKDLAAGADTVETAEKIRQLMHRDGGAAGMMGPVKVLVETLPLAPKQGEEYAMIEEQLDSLSKMVLSDGGVAKQEDEEAYLFPSMSKLRVEAYDVQSLDFTLGETVGKFLSSKGAYKQA